MRTDRCQLPYAQIRRCNALNVLNLVLRGILAPMCEDARRTSLFPSMLGVRRRSHRLSKCRPPVPRKLLDSGFISWTNRRVVARLLHAFDAHVLVADVRHGGRYAESRLCVTCSARGGSLPSLLNSSSRTRHRDSLGIPFQSCFYSKAAHHGFDCGAHRHGLKSHVTNDVAKEPTSTRP
ncbi:MAG: hypothetical protein QOF74_3349 [Caballeronia mineralivorans]|nr:hypothetical protein [Caballeronia mineralivorans]